MNKAIVAGSMQEAVPMAIPVAAAPAAFRGRRVGRAGRLALRAV